VRYVGGVKLGAGGLVRAYTDAIATAMKDAELVERIPMTTVDVVTDYADGDRVRRWAEGEGYEVVDTAYEASVRTRIRMPADRVAAGTAAVTDITQGRAVVAG